jgi:hypothetical protein
MLTNNLQHPYFIFIALLNSRELGLITIITQLTGLKSLHNILREHIDVPVERRNREIFRLVIFELCFVGVRYHF